MKLLLFLCRRQMKLLERNLLFRKTLESCSDDYSKWFWYEMVIGKWWKCSCRNHVITIVIEMFLLDFWNISEQSEEKMLLNWVKKIESNRRIVYLEKRKKSIETEETFPHKIDIWFNVECIWFSLCSVMYHEKVDFRWNYPDVSFENVYLRDLFDIFEVFCDENLE